MFETTPLSTYSILIGTEMFGANYRVYVESYSPCRIVVLPEIFAASSSFV
ncbi:MAG: hypothetical protein Q9M89_05250 [Persephonella sp.]|nr:hypothetical protein [Persephonella sp.]